MARVVGMSWLGNPCRRFLFLKFRDAFKQVVTPELQKIFDDGNRLEGEVIQSLRDAGEDVRDRDANNPSKQIWVEPEDSHWIGGFLDGLIIRDGEEMVLEIKSANAKNFGKMKRYGMKKAKPVYHTQLNCYLGLTGHQRGLWRVINKETNEIYEETLEFDPKKYRTDMERGRAVVDAPDVLEPCKSKFGCRFCDCKDICEGRALPEITCKTCRYYQVRNDQKYARCNKHPNDRCKEPCEDFVYTNNILDMAGFSFGDEDTYWNYKEGHLDPCVLLVRDSFGHEYPLRGIEDCNELKAKMAMGWTPKPKLGY